MRRWTWRGLVWISGHWLVMVSFAAGVAETALLHTWLWPPHQTSPSFSGNEISLRILPKGGRLLVQWNPQSLPVLQGYSGLLTVQDGGRQMRVPLDRHQLQAGSTSYTPTSEWAEFRLEIYRDGNHYSGEAMALATGVNAKKKAVPVDSVLVHDVPQTDFEALPASLNAASSNVSERLEARPPRGSTISSGVKEPELREFSRPTLFATNNTSTPPIVEESPPSINLAQNNTAEIFPSDSEHPSPVPEVPLPGKRIGKLIFRRYDGIIVDAACDTVTEASAPIEPHQHCAVSAATAMFAIRLGDGETLRFDSVGNLRAQNAKIKNRWVTKTVAGKEIRAKVTGAIAGDDLIVVSIE
jgi:hypothetical protein